MDKGPWFTFEYDGKFGVESEDFRHDVQLHVTGDFTEEDKELYCKWLVDKLTTE